MPIQSMTGYGRGEAASRGIKVMVELKSVNHRQFDCRIELPLALQVWDASIREQIHAVIARGSVTCKVLLDFSPAIRKQSVVVDETLARAYLARLRRVAGRLELEDNLRAAALLDLPEVVRFESPEKKLGSCRPLILISLTRALKAHKAMREREGRELERDMTVRLKRLQALAARIEHRAPGVAQNYRKSLLRRLLESGLELNLDDPRLLKEVALYADRSDISEELTRLRSHLRQCAVVLTSAGPAGRTLDFLIQELLREINTIGSKANDRLIARLTIQFKAELERIREQVQNIT